MTTRVESDVITILERGERTLFEMMEVKDCLDNHPILVGYTLAINRAGDIIAVKNAAKPISPRAEAEGDAAKFFAGNHVESGVSHV